jgi:hypothetical protein
MQAEAHRANMNKTKSHKQHLPHLLAKQQKKKVYLLHDWMLQPKSNWIVLSQNLTITYSIASKKRGPAKALCERQKT